MISYFPKAHVDLEQLRTELRQMAKAHAASARRVTGDPELNAYRYGKAQGVTEVLQLLSRPLNATVSDSTE
jgi:hypothetical protein